MNLRVETLRGLACLLLVGKSSKTIPKGRHVEVSTQLTD